MAHWLLPWLKGRKTSAVAEQGSRDGILAATLLEQVPEISVYRGFEMDARRSYNANKILDRWPGASVVRHDPAEILPIQDATQDIFLTIDLLESLRMDQLYMVASEARRTTRAGGLWVLHGLSYGDGWGQRRLASVLGTLHGGRKPFELTHYVSPEDWKTLEDRKARDGLATRQTLVLERLE